MCVRAYRYASVDASKMAQKLCREIWCRSITAAYRTCVYLKNIGIASQLTASLKYYEQLSAAHNTYLLNDTYIKKIRRSLAICFDDADGHFIGDTVFDDLAFSLENLGYFPKEIENMVNNIAKKFKIDDILDMPAEKINDSEKEKVMIASSLIFNPKILLLDESIHKLTPNDKKLVFKILDEYKRKEKLTIILITHDLEDTLKADRIIVLDKGNIVLDGTCEEIYKDDTLEKMGFNLPFIVKLSHNLMLYDVLDKVYFDDVEVMKKLWG